MSVLELFRCRECDHIEADVGSLHVHAERHRGLWGIQWPWRMGNYNALMGMTEILRVDEADVDVVDRGEWEGP